MVNILHKFYKFHKAKGKRKNVVEKLNEKVFYSNNKFYFLPKTTPSSLSTDKSIKGCEGWNRFVGEGGWGAWVLIPNPRPLFNPLNHIYFGSWGNVLEK